MDPKSSTISDHLTKLQKKPQPYVFKAVFNSNQTNVCCLINTPKNPQTLLNV